MTLVAPIELCAARARDLRTAGGVGTRPPRMVPASCAPAARRRSARSPTAGSGLEKGRPLRNAHASRRGVRFWAGLMALLIVPATIGAAVSSAGAAGSNSLTVKAGEYVYKLSGSPKAGWTADQLRQRGRREPHDGGLRAEAGRHGEAAEDRGALAGPERAREDRRAERRPQRCVGSPRPHRPGSEDHDDHRAPGRPLRHALLRPGTRRQVARRARDDQDVRRGEVEVEPEAADQRRDRREHQRHRDHVPDRQHRAERDAQGHEQRLRRARLHPGQDRRRQDARRRERPTSTPSSTARRPRATRRVCSSVASPRSTPGPTRTSSSRWRPGTTATSARRATTPDDDYTKGLKGEFDVQVEPGLRPGLVRVRTRSGPRGRAGGRCTRPSRSGGAARRPCGRRAR